MVNFNPLKGRVVIMNKGVDDGFRQIQGRRTKRFLRLIVTRQKKMPGEGGERKEHGPIKGGTQEHMSRTDGHAKICNLLLKPCMWSDLPLV